MPVDSKKLTALHAELLEYLPQFTEHADFKSRITLLRKGKHLVAEYFRLSIDLSSALKSKKVSEHLESTLRRYAQNTHHEAKKIIAIYIKYGHGCEKDQRLQFQMDVSEVVSLLKHRIQNEKEYLLPEYQRLQEEDSS